MKIRILLFAGLRERFGWSEQTLELPDGATAAHGVKMLCADNQEKEKWVGCAMVAINRNYATLETPLKDGDEMALIPPVAGG